MEKFCEDCDNILYPEEKDDKLVLLCKHCGHEEDNKQTLIVKKMYKKGASTSYVNLAYVVHDNTLRRTTKVKCPNKECKSHDDKALQEAVIMIDKVTKRKIYVCVNCLTQWQQ